VPGRSPECSRPPPACYRRTACVRPNNLDLELANLSFPWPGSEDSILLSLGARMDEFVESTDMPVVGVLLIEELKVAPVDHAKEFGP
jgi:hypothetical protein